MNTPGNRILPGKISDSTGRETRETAGKAFRSLISGILRKVQENTHSSIKKGDQRMTQM